MPACQIDPVQLGREQANLRSRSVSRAGGGSLASYTRRRSQPESCLDLILARRLLRGSASIPDSSSQSRNQTLASSGCQWFKDCPSIAWSCRVLSFALDDHILLQSFVSGQIHVRADCDCCFFGSRPHTDATFRASCNAVQRAKASGIAKDYAAAETLHGAQGSTTSPGSEMLIRPKHT